MLREAPLLIIAILLVGSAAPHAQTQSGGDVAHGAQLFRACGACHSLVPDQSMTGPSLAGVWERKAGTLASFERYSPALKSSGIVWDAGTLDAWLTAPDKLVPDNRMPFKGIGDRTARADIIAFLRQQSIDPTNAIQSAQSGGMGMGGMPLENLQTLGPDQQVQAARLCRDSYSITTKDGKEDVFWEPNLRLKTDSSAMGPPAGAPVLVPAGMMGDRADLIFASPEEISAFIQHSCP